MLEGGDVVCECEGGLRWWGGGCDYGCEMVLRWRLRIGAMALDLVKMVWKKRLDSTGLENVEKVWRMRTDECVFIEGKMLIRAICTKGREEICTLDDRRCSDSDGAMEKLACETG